jgi:hypothetical protein
MCYHMSQYLIIWNIIIIIIILKLSKTFNSNVWMILYYDMCSNVNMPRGTFKMNLIKNIIIGLVST